MLAKRRGAVKNRSWHQRLFLAQMLRSSRAAPTAQHLARVRSAHTLGCNTSRVVSACLRRSSHFRSKMNDIVDIPQPVLPPRWIDYLLVGVFSFILFGYCGFSGRPLTMHEARLPEKAREMKAAGEWLLPHSGIRPWLERPPLPHWIVIGAMTLLGSDNQVWIVRLPSACMGLATVLLTVWMAGKLFGRTIGQLSGLLLATSFEFYRYSGSAEDDIYLAALVAVCVALFAHIEFFSPASEKQLRFWNWRPWRVLAFFFMLGVTNLTKGPLLGILIVGATISAYLLWNTQWRPVLRYLWLWGWIVLIVVSAIWPLWAYHKYPDVLANWKFDYLGRVSGGYEGERWYYYAPTLAWTMLPWTPACLIGLLATAGKAFRAASQPLKFVWSWAIAPLIVLSIPQGKHHHYLVPILAPWAILAAIGLLEIGKWMRAGKKTLATVMSLLMIGPCCGSTFLAATNRSDGRRHRISPASRRQRIPRHSPVHQRKARKRRQSRFLPHPILLPPRRQTPAQFELSTRSEHHRFPQVYVITSSPR